MSGGIQDNNTNTNLAWNQSSQPDLLSKDPLHNVVISGAGGSSTVINLDSVFIAPSDTGVQGTSRGTDSTIAADITKGEINNPLLVPPEILAPGSKPITFAALVDQLLGKVQAGQMTSEDAMSDISEVMTLYGAIAKPAAPSGQTSTQQTGTVAANTSVDLSTSTVVPLSQDELTQVSNLRSSDAVKVLSSLRTLYGLDQNDNSSEEYVALSALATKLAAGNNDGTTDFLDFSTPENLLAGVKTLVQNSDPQISDSILARISISLWALDNRWESNLNSTDANVVRSALYAATDTSKLSDEEKSSVLGYLDILCQALAFMSQIRATIASLNTETSSKQAKAKLSELDKMVDLAVKSFQSTVDQIKANAEALLKQQAQQELWGWLGPLITAVVGIISLISIAVTLGAATPLAIGLMAGVIAATSISLALSTPSVVESLASSLGWPPDDPRTQALICGIEMAVTIVCTFGAGAIAAGVKGIALGAVQITKTAALIGAGLVLQSAFSSGILTSGFCALLKACDPSMSDEDAQMFAMVMTLIFGLLMALIMGGIGATGSKSAVNAAGNAADDAAAQAAKAAGGAPGGASGGASAGASGGGAAAGALGNVARSADAGVESISLTQRMLKNAARFFERMSQDQGHWMFKLQMFTQLFQASGQIQQGVFELSMVDITKQQKDLNDMVTEIESMLGFMQTMLKGFDPAISGLNEDSKKMNEQVANLCKMFEEFILTHSQILNRSTGG